jgi:hypothetical protein
MAEDPESPAAGGARTRPAARGRMGSGRVRGRRAARGVGMLGRWEATEAWCAAAKLGVIRELAGGGCRPAAGSPRQMPRAWSRRSPASSASPYGRPARWFWREHAGTAALAGFGLPPMRRWPRTSTSRTARWPTGRPGWPERWTSCGSARSWTPSTAPAPCPPPAPPPPGTTPPGTTDCAGRLRTGPRSPRTTRRIRLGHHSRAIR